MSFIHFLKCFRSSEIILMLLLNWVDIKWGLLVFLLPMIIKSLSVYRYIYFPFSCPFICVEEAEPEESEEPFVAPAGLSIPPDVELVSVRYSAVFLETLTFSVFFRWIFK